MTSQENFQGWRYPTPARSVSQYCCLHNSGVNNKASALMVDGGSFNGKTITGLGIDKTAKIYYEVQTNLLTSGSDYQDLYDALQQACLNLKGTAGITAADCTQVKNIADATEMNLPAPSPAIASEAPICPTGQAPNDLFFDNLENPNSGNWVVQTLQGANHFYYPQNSHPYGPDYDETYATSGVYNIWGDDAGDDPSDPNATDKTADFALARSASLTLPAGAYLRFNHAYGFEDDYFSNYDGGVFEYSIDNGTTWVDAGNLFTHNGYDGALDSTNPLGARQAFVGQSYGYISSRLDLSSLAGKSFRFRFRIGIDPYVGDYGWYIDDIRLYTCGTTPATSASNVLANPDFELDTNADTRPDSWTSNPHVTRTGGVKHSGSYAMQHTATDNSGYTISQSVSNIQVGAPYAFSGWVNIPSTTDPFSFTLKLNWLNAANSVVGSQTIKTYGTSTGGAWNQATASAVAPTGATSAQIQMVVTSLNATVYVDDFFFGNMLANGGFELDSNNDGRADNWTESVNALRSNQLKRSGRYAMRHYATDNSSYVVSQDVSGIVAGKTYIFDGYVNIPSTNDTFTFKIEVLWRDANNNSLGASAVKTYTASTSTWDRATAQVVAPASATNAQVRMVVNSLAATIVVDDFTFRP
jgi:hypothetical protein